MKLDKFRNAKLKRPTDTVLVSELQDWLFEKDEKAEITVRGLTSNQVFVAREAIQKTNPIHALTKALASGQEAEMVAAFKRYTGNTDETTTETAYRIELLVKGAVDDQGKPLFGHSDAAKLAEHFPDVFIRITTRIIDLSGTSSVVDQGK